LNKRASSTFWLCVVLIAFILAPWLSKVIFGSTYIVDLLIIAMIYGIVALSLNLLLGYMEHASLGHAVYLGISAYTVAICNTKYGMGLLASSMLGIVLAAAAAALFGLFALRARGVYFLMITLSLAMMVWGLAYRWVSMTQGDNGISGIPRPEIAGISLQPVTLYYYFALFLFLLCFFCIYRIIRSPFGKTLVGIKESESRMRALGYNCWLHRYICFVVAGTFSGVAGVLFIFYNQFISPPSLEILPNFECLLMVALGGPGTVVGPFVGSLVIVFIKDFISIYTERWLIVLGVAYIVTIMYAPKGLVVYAPGFWRWLVRSAGRKPIKRGEFSHGESRSKLSQP
jgi:branched-chain amino acid transport system permease protein